MSLKRFYIVKNLTSGEVNSPEVNKVDGSIGSDNYCLLKKEIDASRPTGEYVHEFMLVEDFNAALSLSMFTPVSYGIREYKKYDKRFCDEIILQFESDAGALTLDQTEQLISEFIDGSGLLDAVFVKLEINSPHHAMTKLSSVVPNTLFPQALKDKYISIIEEYLKKYPRY